MTVMVLWKEALSSLRGGSKGSETSDTYDLVFSNKTVLDPVRALPSLLRLALPIALQHLALRAAERVRWGVQLCLEMREHLQAEGLRVWQQATSIPKDSDSKRRSSLCVFSPTSRICLHHGHSQMRQLLLAQTGSQNGTRTRAPPRRSCASSTPTTSSRPTA